MSKNIEQNNEQNNEENKNSPDLPIDSAFKKILVVDDILYVLKSISKILRDQGYFVITAKRGLEALEKFQKYKPDLVTIDQKLPDMTGANLVREIRKTTEGQKTNIIFISAVTEKEVVQDILQLKIDQYLIKPFKKKKLIEVIEDLI